MPKNVKVDGVDIQGEWLLLAWAATGLSLTAWAHMSENVEFMTTAVRDGTVLREAAAAAAMWLAVHWILD